MNRKSSFALATLILLSLGAGLNLGVAPVPRPSGVAWGNDRVQPLTSSSGWAQVNNDGFGDPMTIGVTTLEVFDGHLYAGASNLDQGGRVWRSADGTTWTPVSEFGFGSAYTNTNPVLIDMIEFDSQLYVGLGWDGIGGQIWRSSEGVNWGQVEGNGFGDANSDSITVFAVFTNTLYAATGNDNGLQIWRSTTGDSLSWTNVVTEGFGYAINRQATGFVEFNNVLYTATETNPAASTQVWRTTDGLTWTVVITDGFGDLNNYSTGGFASFKGDLYIGTRNDVTGAQLWRSGDGINWNQVLGDGFGDSSNIKIESLCVFEGLLYTVTYNEVTGMEVWRSSDGATWHQVNVDGFSNSNNYATLWSNATVAFNNRLFIGTWNTTSGGEIWMMLRQVFLPVVRRN